MRGDNKRDAQRLLMPTTRDILTYGPDRLWTVTTGGESNGLCFKSLAHHRRCVGSAVSSAELPLGPAAPWRHHGPRRQRWGHDEKIRTVRRESAPPRWTDRRAERRSRLQ